MARRIKTILFLVVAVLLIGKIAFTSGYVERAAVGSTEEECRVYYLLNMDGMKGLGHSAFLLVDEQGKGLFYSYNGMQYQLPDCLLGKAGIGKMKCYELPAEAVEQFLVTGDLQVSDVSECDNFDRALYRQVSREAYETMKAEADYYIAIGDTFEQLYATAASEDVAVKHQAEGSLQGLLTDEEVPKYQIYHHNCDTVAREIIATVDSEMQHYNREENKWTPLSNYKHMWNYLGAGWGAIHMGEDSIGESVLWYIF